jgi:hypothetical protein
MSWRKRKPTWQERHPRPPGWRPRTRIDERGRMVEPWGFLISDPHGHPLDGGERWLPMGRDPDQAAWEILQLWLTDSAPEFLSPWELPGVVCAARHNAYPSNRVGMAYAKEQMITA